MGKILTFLSICHHFPHQKFPLIIFCCLPARPLFHAGCYRQYVYAPMQIFSVQIYINEKTVDYSYVRQLLAFQTDQQSCTITYNIAIAIIIVYLWLRHRLYVTVSPSHQLFIISSLQPTLAQPEHILVQGVIVISDHTTLAVNKCGR